MIYLYTYLPLSTEKLFEGDTPNINEAGSDIWDKYFIL